MKKVNEIYETLEKEKAKKINYESINAKEMAEKHQEEMLKKIELEYQFYLKKIEKIVLLAHRTKAICAPIKKFEVAFLKIGKKYE